MEAKAKTWWTWFFIVLAVISLYLGILNDEIGFIIAFVIFTIFAIVLNFIKSEEKKKLEEAFDDEYN